MQRHPLRIVPCLLAWLVPLLLAPASVAGEPSTATDEQELVSRKPGWTWPVTREHLRIAAVLRESRRGGPAAGPALLQRLVDAGRDALPAELDILLRGRVPEVVKDDAAQILSDPQRGLLLSALARNPDDALRAALEQRLAATPDEPSARLGALYVLGLVGDGRDLARLATLAPRKPGRDDGALTAEAREAVCTSAALILGRDAGAWRRFLPALREADASAAKVLLESLGRAPGRHAMELLYEAAQISQPLATRAVAIARQCTPCFDTALEQEFVAWMVGELRAATPEYARMLLMSIGALDDGSNLGVLIDRLHDEDSGVREEAYAALKLVTHLAFPPSAEAWESWHAQEEAWHTRERPRLREQLDAPDSARVLAALREYSGHRTRRRELAREIAPLLLHHRTELRILACDVLRQIDSTAVCAELAELLSDSDANVSSAAWQALRAITRQALAGDAESVREQFRS